MDYCEVCGQQAAFRCVDCSAYRCKPGTSITHPVTHPTDSHLTVNIHGEFDVVLAPHLGFIGNLPVGFTGSRCEHCLRQKGLELSGRLKVQGMNGAPSFMIAGRLIALFRIQFEGNHWYPSMAGWRSGFQTPADLLRAVAQHRASGQPWRPAWIRGGEKDVQVLDVPHQVGNWDDGYTNVPWGVDGPLAVTEDGRAVKPAKRPAFSFAPQNTWFYEPISARLLDESALTGEQEYSLLQYVSQLDQSNRPTQLVTA